MPRLLLWQYLIHPHERVIKVFFTERAADAIAVEIHARKFPRAFFPQVFESPALHNAEKTLSRVRFDILPVRGYTSLRPNVRAFHRFPLIVLRR